MARTKKSVTLSEVNESIRGIFTPKKTYRKK